MTDRYCLQYGRLQQAFDDKDAAGRQPSAAFHLTADGALHQVPGIPPLKVGEGAVAYAGDFYVEPLEIQIEFTFNASTLAGKSLVTFEELYDLTNPEEPEKVAEHTDIEDEGQTVTVSEEPVVQEESEAVIDEPETAYPDDAEEAAEDAPVQEDVVAEAVIEQEIQPEAEVIAEEPITEAIDEPEEAPVEEPVMRESEMPSENVAEAPEPQQSSEQIQSSGEMDVESGVVTESGEEVLGEDLYTDYSPEAVVRRAAWNKGLRCRRGYGPYNIPVAFVKGKVAVFVDDGDADTSIDSKLREEGWTVLRYDSSTITDGKAQGEEIAAAVKSNLRSAKAASKKKSKK